MKASPHPEPKQRRGMMSLMFERAILELFALEEEIEQAWKAGSEEEIEASEEVDLPTLIP